MTNTDRTLLPPIPEAPGSGKTLDAVGPLAVLGAMVEHRRRPTPFAGTPAAALAGRAEPSESFVKVR